MNATAQIKATNGIKEIVEAIKETDKCEDITKENIKAVLQSLQEVIVDKLANNEEINFTGCFKLSFRNKEASEMVLQFGKRKGDKIKTKAKKVPICSFGKTLKEGIQKKRNK